MSNTNQQWGGRFSEATDAFVARFTASVDFDQRMYRQDIQGSVAHAKMLAKVGVLTAEERDQILDAGAQFVHGRVDLENSSHRALCIVLVGRGISEHGHDSVTE